MCYSFISKVKQSLLTASCQSSCSEFLFWFSSAYFLKWNCYFSACENLPNSPCHFWKHKSVFLQILHQSSVSSNITLLYFFSSSIIYFGQKEPIKVQIFEKFECSGLNSSSCGVNFETTSRFLFKFCIILYFHDT